MSRLLPPLLLLLLLPSYAPAEYFTLAKQPSPGSGPTLLIIAGIHGDEPGGFNAAALLQTRYRLRAGKLWIIPDLNRTSILRRAHGWYGDLNYKFNGLRKTDPDYAIVQEVKKLLTDPQVDLIFNLHDGSGYYHPQTLSRQRNPRRWGQSLVIDQPDLPGVRFGNLQQLSRQAVQQINQQLLNPQHRFHVKNTDTANSDAVMQKTLTYFSIRHGKPAIALESSKELPTHLRVYYLLSALEAYFQQLGIKFERDFPLTPAAVKTALTEEIKVAFGNNQSVLTLTNMRPLLKQFPLENQRPLAYRADNPLVSVRPNGDRYRLHFGNNRLAFLEPAWVEYEQSLNGIAMRLDKQHAQVSFGSRIQVKESFQPLPLAGYRFKVIGGRNPAQGSQTGLSYSYAQLNKADSVDQDGRIFRLEVYRQEKFCGMILVEFAIDK